MELGAVHRLSEGDLSKRPTCHRIQRNPEADQEEAQNLGIRQTRDAGGGDSAHLHKITHHLPKRGYQGA